MARGASMIVAEGRPWLGLALAACIAALVWAPQLLPFPALLAVLLLLLFRDPAREIPANVHAVVCPVDGWVTAIEGKVHGVADREAIRITISINNFGTYTVRSPVEGKILDVHEAGPAFHGSGGLWVRTDADEDFVLLLRRNPPGIRPVEYL